MIGDKAIASNLRREDRLLLCCIRTFLDKKGSSALGKLVDDEIDWSYLMTAAENQRVLPQVFLSLHNNCAEAIPEDIAFQFQNRFKRNSLNNLSMMKELLLLVDSFSSNGIALIPFKGPIMALDLCGDLSMRQFGDLDILIHLEDIYKASKLLQSMGYKPEYPWDYRLNESQCAAFIRSDHHHRYMNSDKGIMVELHWSIYPPIYKIPRLDMGDIWNRAEINTVFGKEVLSFSTECLLQYLCVHGSQHGWERLSWICDVAMLITTKQVDLQEVLKKADEDGSRRLLFLGLFLVNELLSIPLTRDLIKSIMADPEIPALAAMATRNLFSRESGTEYSNKENIFLMSNRMFFYLKATDRLQDRVNIYLRRAICPTVLEYELIKLPNSLYSLYFIIRPKRLIYIYMTRSIKSLLRLNQQRRQEL